MDPEDCKRGLMFPAQSPRRVALGLLIVSCPGCLEDGRPLAGYAKQMEAYRAGLAAADAGADGGAKDTVGADGLADTGLSDSAAADVAPSDAPVQDIAPPPDIMRWAGDGYVKPPGDPTCAVVETAGVCSDQTGLPIMKVTLNFHNTCTTKTLRLFWYDSDCKAHKYGEVGPGQWLSQQTFLGHAWRFVDSKTGELIAEHVVTTFQGGEVNLP